LPVLRKDEQLDNRNDAEELQCGKSSEEPDKEQNRAGNLGCRGERCCKVRRQNRHAIFEGEELQCDRPACKLRLRGGPEDMTDRKSSHELHQ
jgi:hypothetical protein